MGWEGILGLLVGLGLAALVSWLRKRGIPVPPVEGKGMGADRKEVACPGYLQLAGGGFRCTAGLVEWKGAQFIVTAAHCVDTQVWVTPVLFSDWRKVHFLAVDRQADVAVGMVEGRFEGLVPLRVAESLPSLRAKVWHCGMGIDRPGNVETGQFLGVVARDCVMFISVSPGDSGAPVMTGSGEMVTVVSSTEAPARMARVYGPSLRAVRDALESAWAQVYGSVKREVPLRLHRDGNGTA